MRFADKGYYIEAYIKCANCGVLVYENDRTAPPREGDTAVYCSEWCRDWAGARAKAKKKPPAKRSR